MEKQSKKTGLGKYNLNKVDQLIIYITNNMCGKSCGGASGAIYGLGLIGAAIYFIQNAVGFWGIIIAILKAIVWPAFLIYKALGFLGV